jgi:hypothetical protein
MVVPSLACSGGRNQLSAQPQPAAPKTPTRHPVVDLDGLAQRISHTASRFRPPAQRSGRSHGPVSLLGGVEAGERCQARTLPPYNLIERGCDGPLDRTRLGGQEQEGICPRVANPLDIMVVGAINRQRAHRNGATDLEAGERVQDSVDALSRYVGWEREIVEDDYGGIKCRTGGVLEQLAEGGGHGEVGVGGV